VRRFTFRFGRVLAVKERLEDARKAALGEAQAALNGELQVLAELERQQLRNRDGARGQTATALDPCLLSLNANYALRLQREIAEQRKVVAQVEAIVADRRDKLVEARRQRRTFEILRDKAWGEHQRQTRRQQQLELDEAGEQLHARRGKSVEEAGDEREAHVGTN